MCPVQGFVCLVITLCTGTAVAASPVARVCASSYYGIFVYDASSSGKLTPIKGSPFYPDTTFLQPAGNGKYLYGVDVNNFHSIDTFQITSNGALTFLRNVDLSSFTGLPVSLTFDHTGQTLYVGFYRGNSDDLVAFTVEKGTGELNYVGQTYINDAWTGLTLSGNDRFVYSGTNQDNDWERLSDGMLIEGSGWSSPIAPFYWISYATAAADPNGHVALAFDNPNGITQLATYTASEKGDLTTKNTYLDMPTVAAGELNSLSMSPSGKLLAVDGTLGIQVFHFNGASPITGFTPLLNLFGEFIGAQWDKTNHLYAINYTSNRLHVFMVTTTSAKEAEGSPYTLVSEDGTVYGLYILSL